MSGPTFPASPDRRSEVGPFDIVGDVHGCADELVELMRRLGYLVTFAGSAEGRTVRVEAPAGRRAVFVGDLVDRGPRSPDVLRVVMSMTASGAGLCVPGNHDVKFIRWLQGRQVSPTHGLDATIAQMQAEPSAFHAEVLGFFEQLPVYLWLDGGRLVVAHAGIRADMIGQQSGDVRRFCVYGDTDGRTDAAGLAIRYNWAVNYHGEPLIVYGHTPVDDVAWVHNSVCIDTGCCFGGKLSALRWPERAIVEVPARAVYAERRRPFGLPAVRPD